MITKFSFYKSLVNNDFTAKNFSNEKIFRIFLKCRLSSFSCKKFSPASGCSVNGVNPGLKIQGLATTYNNSDWTNDVIANDAFLPYADSDGFLKKMPYMYSEHDQNRVAGVWQCVRIAKLGVEVEGEVTDAYVISLIEGDQLDSLSIGFYVRSSEYRYNFVKNKNYRYIRNAELVEISLVKNPANSKAFFSPVDTLYFGEKIVDYQDYLDAPK